ncbi:MAG: hypothetical protein ACYCXK_06125 [Candidatus Humimicrobiaceae bacterium]
MDILKKIKSMTTDIGIYQHGRLNKPDPEFGYALEDQSRALLVANYADDHALEKIYIDFIIRAKRKDGLLHHFYFEDDKDGIFKNSENGLKPNTELAFAITLWTLLRVYENKRINKDIEPILDRLIKDAFKWTSVRAMATAILGLTTLEETSSQEEIFKNKLNQLFINSASGSWIWFEDYLCYANAIIPWCFWELYLKRKCRKSLEIAIKTTDFLIDTCQENKIPSPIGNNGWYYKGSQKALFDQQPIDAAYMVCCLEKAFEATGKEFYLYWAKKWFGWFFGNNIKSISLLDNDYGCFDALTPNGVNLNQGAESNICFLMAYFAAKRLDILN